MSDPVEGASPVSRAPIDNETSVICVHCGFNVGGVEAGSRVRWVECDTCLQKLGRVSRAPRPEDLAKPPVDIEALGHLRGRKLADFLSGMYRRDDTGAVDARYGCMYGAREIRALLAPLSGTPQQLPSELAFESVGRYGLHILNSERETPTTWPAGQAWDELVGSSKSTCIRIGLESLNRIALKSAAVPIPQQLPRDQVAWLIEVEPKFPEEDSRRYVKASGYTGSDGRWGFTPKPDRALRFARREDAESVRIAFFARSRVGVRVAEHMWTAVDVAWEQPAPRAGSGHPAVPAPPPIQREEWAHVDETFIHNPVEPSVSGSTPEREEDFHPLSDVGPSDDICPGCGKNHASHLDCDGNPYDQRRAELVELIEASAKGLQDLSGWRIADAILAAGYRRSPAPQERREPSEAAIEAAKEVLISCLSSWTGKKAVKAVLRAAYAVDFPSVSPTQEPEK